MMAKAREDSLSRDVWLLDGICTPGIKGRLWCYVCSSSTYVPILSYLGPATYQILTPNSADWFVDVEDIARLCVIGLLDPSVQSERLFGFAENKNGQDLLTIMQKLRPNNPHLKKPAENVTRDQTEVLPRKRAEDLLRKFYGQPGWTSIEDSLAKGIEGWE